ncbi:MAG: glycoside hydrolase family 99-like domain-containing protein [Hyphomonadaceae bacterium]
MRAELRLELGTLTRLSSDHAATMPILIADGEAPSIALVTAGASVRLAPGEYFVELQARALEGILSVAVLAWPYGGDAFVLPLTEVSGKWRGILKTRFATEKLTLQVQGATRFILGDIALFFDTPSDLEARPTIRAGLVTLARALFRFFPQAWRRKLLSSPERAQWLKTIRMSSKAQPLSRGRQILSGGGADEALVADFENRFAVARGVVPAERSQEEAPSNDVKLVAFHLPQFHPIPENDAWWGKGFTEWTNVTKAVPQFVGHHQPRLPSDLGFYDLRTPGALAQQAALARRYGLSAFCFHYYWFGGRRLLEAPIESFLVDRSIDIEFCLCWANEHWTRRWDGDEHEILIAQDHNPEQHARLFDDLARHMEDSRYLRIDGKPLLVVYRPAIVDRIGEMTAQFRELAARRGWPGMYLVATNAFRFDDHVALGFDALVEFPPHGLVADRIEEKLRWLNQHHTGAVFDYGAVARFEAQRLQRERATAEAIFPGVMPSWDNEARRPGAGVIYHSSTPDAYEGWLRAAVANARATLPADRRMVFINAWNEWAEGAYLEPDRAHGCAYLEATLSALRD